MMSMNHDAPVSSSTNESSRLVINRMVLENFKSYAGKIELGPFNSNFSAVIGPNGSGKSNVIDALLFVFGYRASKLRLPKVADLIHVSEKHPHIPMCSASIYFRLVSSLLDPSTSTSTHKDELFITRTAHKSGKSEYFLNGKPSNFKEVTSLLKNFDVDLDHNRFLILQGEVENIALMKPKGANEHEEGLLEFLEDIIGTNQYEPLIATALQELEEANQLANSKMGNLKLIEKEKISKQSAKEEAEGYIRQQNDISIKKSTLLQLQQKLITEKSFSITKKQAELESTRSELQNALVNSEAELKTFLSKDSIFKQQIQQFETEISKNQILLQEYEKKNIKLQENKKYVKSKLSKAIKATAQDKALIAEKKNTLDSLLGEKVQKGKALIKIEEDLIPAERQLSKLRDGLSKKTAIYQEEIAKISEKLAPLIEKDQLIQANIVITENELTSLETRVNGENLSKCKEELAQNKEELSEKTQELKEIISNIEQIESQYDSLASDSKSLNELHNNLLQQSSSLNVQVMDLKASLQEACSNTGNKIVEALMFNSGIESGIFGRLVDLVSIEERYQIAFNSAIGGSLENILVENTSIAEKCVAYLKKTGLGRKTFIVLDKLAAASKSSKFPGARLYDLLQFGEPKYAPAFYHALRDTLVAKNLDEANEMAFGGAQRYRVVTLEGKLIDKSGAMTGGGNAAVPKSMKGDIIKSKGPSQVSIIRKDLNEAENSLADIQDQCKQCTILQVECKAKLEILKNSRHSLLTSCSKLKNEIEFLNDKTAALEKQLLELEKAFRLNQNDSDKIKECKETLQKLHTQKQTNLDRVTQLQVLIQTQENAILEIGGIAFKSQMSLVNGLKDQIDTIQERKNWIDSECANLEQLLRQVYQKSSKEIDQQQLTNELETVESDLSRNTASSLQVTKHLDKLQIELEEYTTTNESSTKQAHDSLIKTVKKQNYQIGDIEEKLVHITEELASYKKKLVAIKSACEQITYYPLDGDFDILPPLNEELLSEMANKKSVEKLERELQISEERFSNVKRPYLGVLQEYQEILIKFQKATSEANEANDRRTVVQANYESLKKKRLDEFMAGFQEISIKLKEIYQLITLGGNAELELVDSLDPFSEGVLFTVMPPKKSWKNIQHLSGGEKTLSSLALVFALHLFRPTPIYVMDEIDAALDFKNVSIIANYIKERTRNNAQFIVISLRDNMFELADTLLGIYKVNHCTSSVTLQPQLLLDSLSISN